MVEKALLARLEVKPGKADELLAKPPRIEQVDVLAAKVPGS